MRFKTGKLLDFRELDTHEGHSYNAPCFWVGIHQRKTSAKLNNRFLYREEQ